MSFDEDSARPIRRLVDLAAEDRNLLINYPTTMEEVGSIYTPAFETVDPKIYNLNAHSCLRDIQDAWESPHPAARVIVYRLENCFVVGAGLFLDHSFQPIRKFVSQQTEVEIESAKSAAYAYYMSGEMQVVEDDAMVLVKPGYANYGHWLTELLVQPIFLKEIARDINPVSMCAIILACQLTCTRIRSTLLEYR